MSIREFHSTLTQVETDRASTVLTALRRLRQADPAAAISAIEDEPLWPIWTGHATAD